MLFLAAALYVITRTIIPAEAGIQAGGVSSHLRGSPSRLKLLNLYLRSNARGKAYPSISRVYFRTMAESV